MRYLLLCCLLPVLSLFAAELTEDQQAEKDYQAYQETLRTEQLKAMEVQQRADALSQIEKDVATLKADYPALSADAALLKQRSDFKNASLPSEKWALYGKLREIEPRIKALQAKHANGTNVPVIATAITLEKAAIASAKAR
jgi:hypothetical protein